MTSLFSLLAGCSGGDGMREKPTATSDGITETPAQRQMMRKEFVILRELTKQHVLQTELGNAARLETVERHLRERLDALPDQGTCEEEKVVVAQARDLVAKTMK